MFDPLKGVAIGIGAASKGLSAKGKAGRGTSIAAATRRRDANGPLMMKGLSTNVLRRVH
jgi:hypothetical protein